ncbi:MAG: type II toxin-antitoxin system RatA family toxin [Burkholderiales bacterium]
MKTVHKSVLIWHSAQQMFDLVAEVDHYPEFLPWCDRASVLATHEDGVTAEIGIAFSGIRQTFTTRNTHLPGREVKLHLVDGPFSRLDGAWVFTPVGQDQNACRVELSLNYGFKSAALSALVGPVFDKIAASLVDAFVKRAKAVYG